MVIEDNSGRLLRGALLDYGDGFAQKLRVGQRVEHHIFTTQSGHCHSTNWTKFGSRPFNVGIYSGASDWRDMGIFLYGLAEGFQDFPNEKHPLFRGVNASCNYRCAARANLKAAKKLRLDLALWELTYYLILEHER